MAFRIVSEKLTAVCLGRKYIKYFIFGFLGMGACMLSAYVNTFFAAFYNVDTFNATVEIAPVVEETIKLLPLLFYLLIFVKKVIKSERCEVGF